MIKPGLVGFEFTDFKRDLYDEKNIGLLNQKVEIDYLFYGDSITEWWDLKKFLPTEKMLVNRAIAGDRTRFMLFRFDGDCIQLKPKRVVFMGGINDLRAWDLGHDYTKEMTDNLIVKEVLGNIILMNSKAKANGIELIVGSILPINEDGDINNNRVNSKVIEINSKIREFCLEEGLIYLDYYNKVIESESDRIQKDLTIEGLHPNDRGYLVMSEVLKEKLEI